MSSNEIKIKNRQRIYDYIRRNESVSKQDLVVALELDLDLGKVLDLSVRN